MQKWQKLHFEEIRYLKESDKCFYFMEYIIGGKWQASEANSLIYNFKKGYRDFAGNRISKKVLEYRKKAIMTFADDLYKVLNRPLGGKVLNISFIPTSKSKKGQNYDDRFELVLKYLSENHNIDSSLFEEPIEILNPREPSSRSSGIRDKNYIQNLKNNFYWMGFSSREPDILIVFDDVITTGSQFRAYSEFVFENMKKLPNMIGLFWCKAIEKEI